MKKRTQKRTQKLSSYPRISFRVDPQLFEQVTALRNKSDLSYGQIICRSLRKTLPALEKMEADLQAA